MMDPRDRDPDEHEDEPIDAARAQMHGQSGNAATPSSGEPVPATTPGGSASTPVVKTLLVSDLVASTKMVETLGDARADDIDGRHDRLARDLLGRFDGREIDKTDGFLLLFDLPINAVLYALAYHDALADLSAELGVPLSARVGIHLGQVTLRRNSPEDVAKGAKRVEVRGLAKPIAARIASLAGDAQTLMTKAAFDLARRGAVGAGEVADDVRWLEHGPYLFKGVSEPAIVCEVGRQGCAPLTPPPNSEKAKRAIAPGDEETLGWRPAPGLAVPGREGWGLQKEIGKGGFGEVWLARHNKTKEVRAFKFCFKADRLRSLKRELTLFRLMKEVLGDRRDIARLYEVQLEQAPFFLEMEYTAGGDLAAWAKRQGGIQKVPLDTRLEIVAQIGEALSAAHSVGVIHKDVKPTNVLIEGGAGVPPASVPADRSAEPPSPATIHIQAKLTDFGIGQLLDKESLEEAGVTVTGFTETAALTDLASRTGTRLYTAPELLAGKPASIQSDIYALGVLLYQVVVADLNRPLAQGWEDEVKDELLREDIAASVAGSTNRRLRSANELSRRLRTLGSRRSKREVDRQRAVAEQEAEKTRFERAVRRERQLRRIIQATVVLLAVAVGVISDAFRSEAPSRNAEETLEMALETAEREHEEALQTTTRLQSALATLGGREPFDQISERLRADGYFDAARQCERLANDVERASVGSDIWALADKFRTRLSVMTQPENIRYIYTDLRADGTILAVFTGTEATHPLLPFVGLWLNPTAPSPAAERAARHFVMQAEALDRIMEPAGPTIDLGEGHQKYNDRIRLIDVASTELIDIDVEANTVALRTRARLYKDARPQAAFTLQGTFVGVTLKADEVGTRAFSEYLNGLQNDKLPQALYSIGGATLPEGVTLENVRYAGDYALGELRIGRGRNVKLRYSWDSGALRYVLDEEEATRRIRFVVRREVNAEDFRDAWSLSLDTVAPDSGAVGFEYFRACELLYVSTSHAPETESPFILKVNIQIGPGDKRNRYDHSERIRFEWRVVMGAAGLRFDASSAAPVKTDIHCKLALLPSNEDFLDERANRALEAFALDSPIVDWSVESNHTPMRLVATVAVGGRERKYQWRFDAPTLSFTDHEEIALPPGLADDLAALAGAADPDVIEFVKTLAAVTKLKCDAYSPDGRYTPSVLLGTLPADAPDARDTLTNLSRSLQKLIAPRPNLGVPYPLVFIEYFIHGEHAYGMGWIATVDGNEVVDSVQNLMVWPITQLPDSDDGQRLLDYYAEYSTSPDIGNELLAIIPQTIAASPGGTWGVMVAPSGPLWAVRWSEVRFDPRNVDANRPLNWSAPADLIRLPAAPDLKTFARIGELLEQEARTARNEPLHPRAGIWSVPSLGGTFPRRFGRKTINVGLTDFLLEWKTVPGPPPFPILLLALNENFDAEEWTKFKDGQAAVKRYFGLQFWLNDWSQTQGVWTFCPIQAPR